jgi:hypothetical protein
VGFSRADLLSETGDDALAAGGPWTGSGVDGLATGQDCEGWTNASADVAATLGTGKQDDLAWGGGTPTLRCNSKAPLICFQIQ